jgi:hypothetical protein
MSNPREMQCELIATLESKELSREDLEQEYIASRSTSLYEHEKKDYLDNILADLLARQK